MATDNGQGLELGTMEEVHQGNGTQEEKSPLMEEKVTIETVPTTQASKKSKLSKVRAGGDIDHAVLHN